jgi:hypothetical protein
MFSFECESHKKNILIFFLGQYEKSMRPSLATDIQKTYDNNLTPDYVIFLYPEYLEQDILKLSDDDDSFKTDLTRQKGASVQLCTFNNQGRLKFGRVIESKENPRPDFDLDVLARDLIRFGYKKLMAGRENDVIVRSPSGTIFVKPSGKPLEEFIYASQLARCSAENQFLAFSLLSHAPEIKNIDCIYIDTSSISAIAESLTYYISRFGGHNCKGVKYTSFSSYSGLSKNRPDSPEGAWVVISASATTDMGRKIVNEWNVKPTQVVTILSYKDVLSCDDKNTGNDVVFSVTGYSKRQNNPFSPVKVQVKGESFSAEISLPSKVLLKKIHAPTYIKESIFDYSKSNVFLVNKENRPLFFDYDEFRNSHINNQEDEKYLLWLNQVIRWVIPNNVNGIICDSKNAKSRFLTDVKNAISNNGFDLGGIVEYNSEDYESFKKIGDKAVLVISTAISSGHSFVDVNRSLRLASHKGMRIFIAPFVTAPSRDIHEKFEKSLCQGTNGFNYVFKCYKKVFIGEKSNTTWVREKALIASMISNDSSDFDYWVKRKQHLENSGDGLSQKIGLHYSDQETIFSFSNDFVFWPQEYDPSVVKRESIYATIAAIFQNLRENEFDGVTLKSNVYNHAVLDPENFVRFNEPILQSCLWRAASPQELDYRRSDELSGDIQRIFSKIFQSVNFTDATSTRGEVALDLLMAVALDWIKLSEEPKHKLINDAEIYLTAPHAKVLVAYLRNMMKNGVSI